MCVRVCALRADLLVLLVVYTYVSRYEVCLCVCSNRHVWMGGCEESRMERACELVPAAPLPFSVWMACRDLSTSFSAKFVSR